jgi:hypothetical protein
VHEGNRYFEHCYGADFDVRVTPSQNLACWQAWVAHYNRFQPAQRVDYAMRRVEALEAGEPPLRLPGLPGSAAANTIPPSSNELKTAQGQPSAAASTIPTILNGCLEACNGYEGRCVEACEPNAVNCRNGCNRERSICLAGCY